LRPRERIALGMPCESEKEHLAGKWLLKRISRNGYRSQ
jgi:hypothetical protein